jgi:hypothetical protein
MQKFLFTTTQAGHACRDSKAGTAALRAGAPA